MVSGNIGECIAADWTLLVTIDHNICYQVAWIRRKSKRLVCAERHCYGTGWGNGAERSGIRNCNHRINREAAYIISNIIVYQSAAYRSTSCDVIYSRQCRRVCSGARESVRVTLVTVSVFTRPIIVNSVPVKVTVLP